MNDNMKMGTLDVSQLADILRPSSCDVFSGKGKLCLSVNYLNKLNSVIDKYIAEDMNCFHIVQSNTKTTLIKDVQFLSDLILKTCSLRITPDLVDNYSCVDISRFKNVKILEIYKLNINLVVGLQRLRSQIQELACSRSIQTVSDVLEKCGGDNSQRYNWNELKKANFSHNAILELDSSIECTLALHSLDLSHNELSKIDLLNQLPNLKHLNLSYNKLVSVPNFKGQICSRLQVLIVNNNFIEELQGLTTIVNLLQLDLGQNCLLEHKSLLYISHLSSLQWLNLQGNPLSFHPQHRSLCCNYLNKNVSTLKFSLDSLELTKAEKSLTGSFYPITQSAQLSSSSNNSCTSLTGSVREKPRRIRNVTIEDDNDVKDIAPVSTPSSSLQHLELKRQVEQLREEYGESWLYRNSGLIVQDVLGFEKTSVLSSTPKEEDIESLCFQNTNENMESGISEFKTADNTQDSINNETFQSADNSIFNNIQPENDSSDSSDGEDIYCGGEECIFLATNKADNSQVFLVVTDKYISERNVTTSKEKARWHLNSVINCEVNKENGDIVKLDFDTLRRDRKQRLYELDEDEREAFLTTVRGKLENRSESDERKKTHYQCIKCSEEFQKEKNALLDQPSVSCPNCEGNLVVERT
nr:serine/threonine-protein kinase 11-interacting protein [Leptinotarsa decemlineata]